MNLDFEKRLSNVETGLEVLETQCEGCKEMQEREIIHINDKFGQVMTAVTEIRDEQKTTDRRNVRLHFANLGTLIAVLIALAGILLKEVLK